MTDFLGRSLEPDIIEKRVFARFPIGFSARVKGSSDSFGSSITVKNASAQGFNLLSRQSFNINDNLDIEVAIPDGKAPMVVSGEVVWTKGHGVGLWDVGIKFNNIRLVHMSRLYKVVGQI